MKLMKVAVRADVKLRLNAPVIRSSRKAETKPPLDETTLEKIGTIKITKISVPDIAEKTVKMERLPDN